MIHPSPYARAPATFSSSPSEVFFRLSSVRLPSCELSSFLDEHPPRLVVQQDPERVDAERGAERQHEEIRHGQPERGQPAGRLAAVNGRPGPGVPRPGGQQRGGEDAERDGGDAGRNLAVPRTSSRRRPRQRRASTWTAEQQSDRAPDDLQDAEQLDVRGHRVLPDADDDVDAGERRAGGMTEKRMRSPPRTPAGTRSSTSWNARRSPQPPQSVTPLLPRLAAAAAAEDRSGAPGMPIGTVVPSNASRGVRTIFGRQLLERARAEERVAHAVERGRRPRENRWRLRRRTSRRAPSGGLAAADRSASYDAPPRGSARTS